MTDVTKEIEELTDEKIEQYVFNEEEQLKIVKRFPLAIVLFDDPSPDVQKLAYAGNKEILKVIKNPHPGLELMDT